MCFFSKGRTLVSLLFVQEDTVLSEVVHVRIPILFNHVGNKFKLM